MALVLADRVKDTTTTTGTGAVTLSGTAPIGFRTFGAGVGNGNTTYYTIAGVGTSEWEVGIGTYTAAGTSLSRDVVLASSNANALVNFSAGDKDVFVTYTAAKSVNYDASGNVNINITGSAASATNLSGGAANAIPYQTGAGTTTFLSTGTGVLVASGGAPSWSQTPTLTSVTLTSGTVSTTPSSGNDLANKTYVDTMVASGITYHTAVKYEVPNTTGNLNATYNNGTGGVGATLTNAGTLGAFTPDGVVAQVGDRILVYNQTNAAQNGVYTVTTVGNGSTPWVLTRATDANSYGVKSPTALGEGDAFFVTSGNTGAGETYVCNTVGTITFGTTPITFTQVSSAQVYSAGTGLTLTGTQFSLTSPVATTLGGTGLTSYTSGGAVYATSTSALTTGTLPVTAGGTGQTSFTNGQLLIGNTTGNTLTKATLTAGAGISVTNGAGSITVTNTAPDQTVTLTAGSNMTITGTYPNFTLSSADQFVGTVTSVSGTGSVNGITLSGTVTSSGSLTLGGTLSGVSLTTQVTGTLPVANGGTGQTSYLDGQLLIGNSVGNTLTKATLTAGAGISVTNGNGSISIGNAGVTTFNTRTGAVTLTSGDVTTALGYTPYNPSTVLSITNTTASTLYTNGALVVAGGAGIAGRVTVNDIINRITGSGNSAWLQQDGTGRISWYWNTYGGTSPVFTNAGEDAAAITMTHTGSGAGGSFFHRSASGVGKAAGDPISWTTTIYSDINTFTWKGYTVLQSNNYNSYAPTLTGTGASGTWGISITGNAVNLSTNRTNWSTNGTISAVVGQLAWKNYGNSHTIFDASAGTAPDGSAVSNTNAAVPWTATYPTLMGWNGSTTYGVRVDRARLADTAALIDGGTF